MWPYRLWVERPLPPRTDRGRLHPSGPATFVLIVSFLAERIGAQSSFHTTLKMGLFGFLVSAESLVLHKG